MSLLKKKKVNRDIVLELWWGLFYHKVCATGCGKVHCEVIRRYKIAIQCGETSVYFLPVEA